MSYNNNYLYDIHKRKHILVFRTLFIFVDIEHQSGGEEWTNPLKLTINGIKNGNFTNTSVYCYDSIHDHTNVQEQVIFWIDGVLIPLVGGFGLLGNILSTAALQKCPGNKCFNVLLS